MDEAVSDEPAERREARSAFRGGEDTFGGTDLGYGGDKFFVGDGERGAAGSTYSVEDQEITDRLGDALYGRPRSPGLDVISRAGTITLTRPIPAAAQ